MCFAAPGIGAIFSALGSVVGAVGTIASAQAQAAAAKYQAKQQRMMAEDALKRGAVEEQGKRRQTAALEARQKAVMAGSNLDIGSGSPLAILGDTAQLGELDALTIRGNAQREATFGRNQAKLYDMEASSARTAGWIGAGTSILSGIGTVAEKWYKPYQSAAKPASSSFRPLAAGNSWYSY